MTYNGPPQSTRGFKENYKHIDFHTNPLVVVYIINVKYRGGAWAKKPPRF